MKNKGWIVTLIIVFSLLVVALITVLVKCINGSFSLPKLHVSREISHNLLFDETYPNTIKRVQIETSSSDIEVKKTTGDEIRIVVYGEKDLLETSKTDNALYVHFEEKKCFGFCFHMKQNKVIVYLPASYNQTLLVDNDYGDVAIDAFMDATIEVNEDCGDVSILGEKSVKVTNHYGDVTIREGEIIEVKESAGDVEISKGGKVTVENNYGDIEIGTVEHSLSIQDDCGDIEIEHVTLLADSTITNDYGDIEIGTTNAIYIDAKTDLGDVKVNHNERKADVTLTIRNSCGDIEVNN